MKESTVQNNLNLPPVYTHKNLRIIFSITLMAVMGVVSVTPAFPKIVEALHISMKEIGLLITVFTFPGVLLTPVLGVLADRFGRKRIWYHPCFCLDWRGWLVRCRGILIRCCFFDLCRGLGPPRWVR